MRSKLLLCFLVLALSCKNRDKAPKTEPIQGAWILVNYSANGQDFWDKKNQVPLGFRFYSSDSVEVYRTNYCDKPERFVPYKSTRDSLNIFHSDSLGWWKQHAVIKGDTLTVFVGSDTLIYERLFNSSVLAKPNFQKIILTAGSSWGGFISAVLYPNGKTCIYLNPRQGKSEPKFFIRQTPGLYSKLIESYYWVSKIIHHDRYGNEFWPRFNPGVSSDGDFSEMVMIGKDSTWSRDEGALRSYQMDMLGLQGFAFTKILKELAPKLMFQIPDSIKCDSVRKTLLPICMVESVSNHLAVVTLISESITPAHQLINFPRKDLDFYFKTRKCSMNEEKTIRTDGTIIQMDGAYYDIGFDFIDIIKNKSTF